MRHSHLYQEIKKGTYGTEHQWMTADDIQSILDIEYTGTTQKELNDFINKHEDTMEMERFDLINNINFY